jgi:hypothetical protein
MYMLFNVAISEFWKHQDPAHPLEFPGQMKVDYVRVYQNAEHPNHSCDPPSHPTSAYIKEHPTWSVPVPVPNANANANANASNIVRSHHTTPCHAAPHRSAHGGWVVARLLVLMLCTYVWVRGCACSARLTGTTAAQSRR